MMKIIFFLSCVVQSIIGYDISTLTTPQIATALSPVWDDKTHSLYFVNFLSQGEQTSIYSYNVLDGILYGAYIEGVSAPSFITPIKNKSCDKCKKCTSQTCEKNECGEQLFAVGVGHDILIIQWNGKATKARVVRKLYSMEENNPMSRTNFARADRKGRLYSSTFTQTFCNASATSGLYRYTKTRGVELLFTGTVSATGVVIDENTNKLYHLDTCTLIITVFDWDPKTGNICNGRIVLDFKKIGKSNDSFVVLGLEIDTNGILYTADYSGAVWKINPKTSSVVDVIKMPKAGITGVALGGVNRDTLYVTAATTIINSLTGEYFGEIADSTGLYAINGLDSIGEKSTRLYIKSNIKLTKYDETC